MKEKSKESEKLKNRNKVIALIIALIVLVILIVWSVNRTCKTCQYKPADSENPFIRINEITENRTK